MLENWLKPIRRKKEPLPYPTHQLGHHVVKFEKQLPELKGVQIAFLGAGKAADSVRESLYQLSHPFTNLHMVDLGNFRKNTVDFMIPAIEVLLKANIIPILIGDIAFLSNASYKAFNQLLHQVSLVVVDREANIPNEDQADPNNYLEEILLQQGEKPYHLSLIGCQAHMTNPELFSYLEAANFDMMRLGRAQAHMEELEPMIRDADLMTFNLAAMEGTAAPEQPAPSPSGFSLSESCIICRYAGMSDKLKAFSIVGVNATLVPLSFTAQAIAQLIWYFLDGVHNRKQDFPVSMDGLTEYIVDLKQLDYQLTFWRSSKSGRWWMQIPFKRGKSLQRHRLVSCSYGDYKKASKGELPERLLHALRKYA
jgi:formiminoglutamase